MEKEEKKIRLHTRKRNNKGLTYAFIAALVLHVLVGIGIRSFGIGKGDPVPPPKRIIKIHEITISKPFEKEITPIKRREIKSKPIVSDYSIPVVDVKIITDDPVVFDPNADKKPTTINIPPGTSKKPKGITQPVSLLISNQPKYPRIALKNGIEGTVIVKVEVDKLGTPYKVEISQSSGSDMLDNAALRAARKCKFSPAINNGDALESTAILYYKFIITDKTYTIEGGQGE
ncbi:energy transducer TonB [Candidatus Dependentiae bacterium]|nr:energy transducer TonB [Candidatus Dependentiae bacterium]